MIALLLPLFPMPLSPSYFCNSHFFLSSSLLSSSSLNAHHPNIIKYIYMPITLRGADKINETDPVSWIR